LSDSAEMKSAASGASLKKARIVEATDAKSIRTVATHSNAVSVVTSLLRVNAMVSFRRL
jgi:hypothetical protein